MKILLLTQWFDPEPTFKGLIFAQALQKEGHDVEVVTGFPNYPGGKIYEGYKIRRIQKETIDGVHITRLPLYPSHDSSGIRRALNYISFSISAFLYGIFGARSADVIYVYHPPLTVGVAAAAICAIRRQPFVYDVQDLWPDSLRATGMVNSEKLLSITNTICNWVYRRAAHIVVLSDGFREALMRRGVPPEKLTVIHNWCDEAALRSNKSDARYELPSGFNVVFAGNMGHAQALESVLGAAQLCSDRKIVSNFIFIGTGNQKKRLEHTAATKKLKNVHFLPRIPLNEIGTILMSADALLVHLRDDDLFRITIPSKTQAYMAIGRPIIMAVAGDAADLVVAADAGVSCRPENPVELAGAITKLAASPSEELLRLGKNGRRYYNKNLSLQNGTRMFLDVFEKVTRR